MKTFSLAMLAMLVGCEQKSNDARLGYGEGDDAFIAAPQPGWVTQMKVQRGQTVRRGDLLFVLDDTQQQAGRDQAAAQLAASKASLEQEKSNLAYARTELDRQNALAKSGAGTPTAHDQAVTNFQQSSAHVSQLEAQIAQMEASLTGAAYGLAQRQIIAQTDGPVQDIYFPRRRICPRRHPGAVAAAARQCLCALLRAGDTVRPGASGRQGAHLLRRLQ